MSEKGPTQTFGDLIEAGGSSAYSRLTVRSAHRADLSAFKMRRYLCRFVFSLISYVRHRNPTAISPQVGPGRTL